MKVDHISISTTPINLLKGNDLVSQGSGFYYVRFDGDQQILFLITNYHVLTGSSPSENKPPLGDRITFQFHQSDEETGNVKTVMMPLFTKHGKPVWISSTTVPEVDLAVIPIVPTAYQGCKVYGIASHWANPQMKIRPTTPVTLIGYPYGFYDTKNALPIWKTGTVASEPEIDFDGKPLVLIDVSAFPGMSGAPAFAISSGMYELHDGNAVAPGMVRQFLGIYASMQMVGKHKFLEQIPHGLALSIRDSESLQIGNIWKAKLILETVDAVDKELYAGEILNNLV
jgi:hypothetical protein